MIQLQNDEYSRTQIGIANTRVTYPLLKVAEAAMAKRECYNELSGSPSFLNRGVVDGQLGDLMRWYGMESPSAIETALYCPSLPFTALST
jgi:hypothetical protein